MDLIAKAMYARGLVNQPNAETWHSYEQAADENGFPREYVRAMGTWSGDTLVAEKPYELGWEPHWNEKKYLESIDQQVQDVLDLDNETVSVFDSLLK